MATLAIGLLVAVAPFAWYGLVFTDRFAPTPATAGSKAAAAVFALPGFVVLAVLRRSGMVSRAGCVLALVVAATAVVALQYATLDPSDTSSTASLGFLFESVYGVVAVLVVAALDGIVRAIARRRG